MNLFGDATPIILLVVGCVAVLLLTHCYTLWERKRKRAREAGGQRNSSAELPSNAPLPEEFATQLMAKQARKACLVLPDRKIRPINPMSTIIGNVMCGGKGETWPVWNDRPMVGVCQFNLQEAIEVPTELSDLAFISIFMARGDDGWPIDFPAEGEEEGDKWIIRTYQSLEELTPYPDKPEVPDGIRPCGVNYRVIEDYPGYYEELYETRDRLNLPDEWINSVEKCMDQHLEPDGDIRWGTKLGGWPAPVQDPIERPVTIQLGSESEVGLAWVDSGCVYLWRNRRGGEDSWQMEMQFY